jgi:hypothetical protein
LVTLAAMDFDKLTTAKWAVAAAVGGAALLFWWATNRRPRARKGRVGCLIAIRCDNAAHERRIRSDLIDTLRSLLHTRQERRNIEIVVYGPDLAGSITDLASATDAMTRSRCLFALWGRARVRTINGQPHHVIDLQAAVRHRVLEEHQVTALAREFASVMPKQLAFGENNDVFAFQLTSEVIDVAARYIIGLAALAHGDLDYGEKLLLEVRDLTAARADHPAAAIARRVAVPLAELYQVRTLHALAAHRRSGDPADLARAERMAERGLHVLPGNPGPNVTLAYCAFELRRDVRAAREHLRAGRGSNEPSWRVSEAFLSAYEGRLTTARQAYKAVFANRAAVAKHIDQWEEHIRSVLAREPARYHLHACLAWIAFLGRQDMTAAVQEADAFLSHASASDSHNELRLLREMRDQAARQIRRAAGVQEDASSSTTKPGSSNSATGRPGRRKKGASDPDGLPPAA